jgi:ornithine cyclodeaminase
VTAPSFPFTVIDGGTVRRVVFDDLAGCIAVVRDAYLAHGQGRSVNPNSLFLAFPDRPRDRIIALPAHLGVPWSVSGIKWIASYPENTARGFPRASAVLILNDADTGYPFACLESSVISASRTAASAALAAQHLHGAGRRARALAIIGTGLISRYTFQFLRGAGWELDEVVLFDLDPAAAARFRDRVCAPCGHGAARIAATVEDAITSADLVLFATTAATPHVHDAAVFAHRPVVLHLSLRDLAPRLLLDAWNVVDDVDHVMRARTSAQLAEELSGSRAFATATLAQVIEGQRTIARDRAIVFSPFGLGVLDLAVGKWVYEAATRAGAGHPIDRFFDDLDP